MKPQPLQKVISASRRIDMVGCFPEETAEKLAQKCPPEKVHSLVLWTKNPLNLWKNARLKHQIEQYSQLFIHFTITGMGGSRLEPNVPTWQEMLAVLPNLIRLTRHPDRIRFRFDPIVHLTTPEKKNFSNLTLFEKFAPVISELNIQNVSISWMSVYKKVRLRLAKHGFSIITISSEQRKEELNYLNQIARKWGLQLHFCGMPDLPISRCIDGFLLSSLHPQAVNCSQKRAKGQRKTCGCTESWDIGWYYPCGHGCLYCYGNPQEQIARD